MKKLIIILGLFLGSAGFVYGAGQLLGGNLWYDSVGRLGIGVQNPTQALEVSGNGVFSGTVTANGELLGSGGGSYTDADVNAYIHASTTILKAYETSNVFATSTTVSASDSNNKSVTAWCPVGYRAVGGGGQINAGASTDIHAENSYPTATTSGWIFSMNEGDAVAGNWQITAHVVCLKI